MLVRGGGVGGVPSSDRIVLEGRDLESQRRTALDHQFQTMGEEGSKQEERPEERTHLLTVVLEDASVYRCYPSANIDRPTNSNLPRILFAVFKICAGTFHLELYQQRDGRTDRQKVFTKCPVCLIPRIVIKM